MDITGNLLRQLSDNQETEETMSNRIYKISEEQYQRLCEDGVYSSATSTKKPETVIQTTKSELTNAVPKAIDTNANAIEITDAGTNESVITKKELMAEARKEWKKGTKVVKMSELLKK